MKRTSIFGIGVVLAASFAAACSSGYGKDGDAPPPHANVGATPSDPSQEGPTGQPSDVPDPIASSDASAHDAGADANANTDAGASSGSDAAVAPPTVACSSPATDGAYFFRCSAAAPTITPGGAIEPGRYLLGGYWENTCSTLQYGAAEVFVQDGKTYMRWERIAEAPNTPPGTTYAGTWELDAEVSGSLTRSEVCSPALVDRSTTGIYQQTSGAAAKLVFVFGDRAETWIKQQTIVVKPPDVVGGVIARAAM